MFVREGNMSGKINLKNQLDVEMADVQKQSFAINTLFDAQKNIVWKSMCPRLRKLNWKLTKAVYFRT